MKIKTALLNKHMLSKVLLHFVEFISIYNLAIFVSIFGFNASLLQNGFRLLTFIWLMCLFVFTLIHSIYGWLFCIYLFPFHFHCAFFSTLLPNALHIYSHDLCHFTFTLSSHTSFSNRKAYTLYCQPIFLLLHFFSLFLSVIRILVTIVSYK